MKKCRKRNVAGASLIELLIVTMIMTLVASAIMGVLILQNAVGFKTFSKASMLLAATKLQDSLENKIHSARLIGNQNGIFNEFFDGTKTYKLGPQTLFFQIPIYTSDGFPTKTSLGNWNVDTYLYNVEADNSITGKGRYKLTLRIIPGDHSQPNFEPSPNADTRTILTNIIGPTNPSDSTDPTSNTPPPRVFSYYSKDSPSWSSPPNTQTFENPSAALANRVSGIAVEVEIFGNEGSARKDMTPNTVAFRSEYFLKGNSYYDVSLQ